MTKITAFLTCLATGVSCVIVIVMPNKLKIARVATTPSSFIHIEQQVKDLRDSGFDVSLISSQTADFDYWKERIGVRMLPLSIARDVSLWGDLKSLFNLIKIFRKEKFVIVHSSTPKGGLLSAVAGFIARVPIRYHTFTGQRWATLKGPMRFLLKKLDSLVVHLNTHCFADSNSQIEYLLKEGVISSLSQVTCLGAGSFGGIDTKRFHPMGQESRMQLEIREKLPKTKCRFIFLGRIVEDKGINELVAAFDRLTQEGADAQLMIVGTMDEKLSPVTLELMKNNKNIFFLGLRIQPEQYLSASDILLLPSYREGFGTAVLEAAACEVPCIGTRIPGLIDAIVENETGLLVRDHSVEELLAAMRYAYSSQEEMKRLGANARTRCVNEFDVSRMSQLTLDLYKGIEKQYNDSIG